MAIYDFFGNPEIVASSALTVKKNNPALVTEMLTVAQSYLNQTDIEYADGNTILDKSTASDGIDCSTYVGLVLMGYAYTDSPYYTQQYKAPDSWTENDDYVWSLPIVRYKASKYADGNNPTDRCRYASQLARLMRERGQEVSIANGFRDVMPGDIVFWAAKYSSTGEWVNPTFYEHISHVGIVLSKENAPNTYVDDGGTTRTWDKSTYPYKHTIIEVTSVDPDTPCINTRYLERRMENAAYLWDSNVNTVAMICRPDLGCIEPSAT